MSKSNARKKKSKNEEKAHNEEDELQNIIDRMISEEYIMKVTGFTDLIKVEHLQLVVDTSVQSVFGLNELLPNLKYLSLDKSVIGSVRDLGSGLRHIMSLSLANCGLCDLDGIGVLTGLQEINLSDNHISDVAPLAMHENLQTLNVSGNKLMDISIGDALSSCPNLKSLFLARNSIAKAPNYRIIMSSLIPSLEMLDGSPVSYVISRTKVTNSMILEAASAMRLIEEELDDELRLQGDILGSDNNNNTSNNGNGTTSNGMMSPTRNNNNNNNNNNASWKQTGIVPNTGSELTHGSAVVLAGSMASAMRQRRNNNSNRNSRDESALEALDAPHAYESGSHMYKEGDITAITLNKLKCQTDDFEYTDLPEGQLSSVRSSNAAGRPQQSPRVDSTTRSSQSSGKFFLNFEDTSSSTPSRPRTASNSNTKGRFDTQPEPRQMNSSRPQSAASTAGLMTSRSNASNSNGGAGGAGSSGKLLTSFSIPFKVGSSVEVEKTSSRPPSGSSLGSSRAHSRHNSKDFEIEEVDVMPSMSKSKSNSIVHLDIVKRHSSAKNSPTVSDIDGVESIPIDDGGVDDDSSSDNENIAVTHAARHRLMSASATNSTATTSRARTQVLSQLFSNDRATPTERSTPTIDVNRRPPIKPATATTSSKAGKSLGFNLAGSLAAIDQWVHDMNSEDESEVKPSTTLSAGSGHKMEEEENDDVSPNMQRILSRDVIINMCAGSTGKVPNTSRKVESDSDDSDEEEVIDVSRRRAPAKMFLGDSHVPLNATTSSLLNKANNIMNIPRADPPPRASSSSTRKSSTNSNIVITKEPVKAVKLKAPLPEFGNVRNSKVDLVEVNIESTTPVKKNGKFGADVDEVSPPRYTSESAFVVNKLNCGSGVSLSDADIVTLLRKPPKETVELRTKGNFATYFRGISAARMKSLLTQAYSDAESIEDRDAKVLRRMELLVDVVP